MSSSESIARVLPVFAAAFAVAYLVVEQNNWPLFTYHPRTGDWGWLHQAARAPNSPAMHWFGWLTSSFLVASAASALALPVTRRWQPPVWIGWAVPLAVMVAFVYLFRGFFLR